MNKALLISKKIFNIQYLSIIGIVALSGCSDTLNAKKSSDSKVDIPKTPPLVAGISVSKSLYQQKYPTQDLKAQLSQQIEITPKSSILTNEISIDQDTPEATLKKAIDTIYFGKAEEAAQYYQTNIPNLANELKNTQKIFQQTIDSITIKDIKINEKKDEVILHCVLKMKHEKSPQASDFLLRRIDGKWLIIG